MYSLPQNENGHHLFTVMLFQICIFNLSNAKEDILSFISTEISEN